MKKLIALCSLIVLFAFAFQPNINAQDVVTESNDTIVAEDPAANEAADEPVVAEIEEEPEAEEEDSGGLHNVLKEKFIEGGPTWMTPVLICLIIGLALCIERIITLSLSSTNTDKLLAGVNNALKNGDLEGAKTVCKSTAGPVASIFFQGLERVDEGIDIVEKSIISYGSVQMGLLERGLVWISLFIALAPMLGFMGTVIGMIQAFDDIAAAGDINPTIVADGIRVALLTTAFGLIVAIILQIFYNYIISKVDGIVNKMEDASITFVDMLVKYNITK